MISGFLKANQAGKYVGILDEENHLVLLDIEKTDFETNTLDKQTLKFDEKEVHEFCIEPEHGFVAVLFWNESNVHIYQGARLLFKLNTIEYSPFDASSVSAEKIHFIEFKGKCSFMAIALSNGYVMTFNFYPEIFEKLQRMSRIDPNFKLDKNLKETLLKFS